MTMQTNSMFRYTEDIAILLALTGVATVAKGVSGALGTMAGAVVTIATGPADIDGKLGPAGPGAILGAMIIITESLMATGVDGPVAGLAGLGIAILATGVATGTAKTIHHYASWLFS